MRSREGAGRSSDNGVLVSPLGMHETGPLRSSAGTKPHPEEDGNFRLSAGFPEPRRYFITLISANPKTATHPVALTPDFTHKISSSQTTGELATRGMSHLFWLGPGTNLSLLQTLTFHFGNNMLLLHNARQRSLARHSPCGHKEADTTG